MYPPNYFPSSDPRPHTLFWHSCRHTIWKYLSHMYSDILSDTLSISFILFLVLSGSLSGMYSDIFSGIYSGILFVSPSRIFLKHGRPSPSIILSATDTLMKSACVLPIHIMLLYASGGISGFWRRKLLRQDAPTHTVRCSFLTPGHVEIHGSASKLSIRARKEPYEIAAAIQMGSVGAGCCCNAIRKVEFLASSWHIVGRLGIHLFLFSANPKQTQFLYLNKWTFASLLSGLPAGHRHHFKWRCRLLWDLALAVEVRQCPLRSGARGWGPAVPTEIWSSRLRSSSAHWDLELAVEVQQCPLRSGVRGWGPAVPTEIWSSLLGGRKERKDGRRK